MLVHCLPINAIDGSNGALPWSRTFNVGSYVVARAFKLILGIQIKY